jgi:hypothetical protein
LSEFHEETDQETALTPYEEIERAKQLATSKREMEVLKVSILKNPEDLTNQEIVRELPGIYILDDQNEFLTKVRFSATAETCALHSFERLEVNPGIKLTTLAKITFYPDGELDRLELYLSGEENPDIVFAGVDGKNVLQKLQF